MRFAADRFSNRHFVLLLRLSLILLKCMRGDGQRKEILRMSPTFLVYILERICFFTFTIVNSCLRLLLALIVFLRNKFC